MSLTTGDEAMTIPVATPVSEKMVRNAVPPAPQPLYQAGAVSDVALSSGAECRLLSGGCNSLSYGIRTMQPNASGVPVPMHTKRAPSMKIQFSNLQAAVRILTIFDPNGTDVYLNRLFVIVSFASFHNQELNSSSDNMNSTHYQFALHESNQIPQVRCWPHSTWITSVATIIWFPRCILRLAAQLAQSDKTMGAGEKCILLPAWKGQRYTASLSPDVSTGCHWQ
jgi:hypothetical protein